MAVIYRVPEHWIKYDLLEIQRALIGARAAMTALTEIPYQKSWADELQKIQLKREVAGTSRIEGAEFTEHELDVAMRESPEQLETRSQRQAAAAVATYRWIASLPSDFPIDDELILGVHRRIVQGCDDDHCPPGKLRIQDENVVFGTPRHRGASGGKECVDALKGLLKAVNGEFREHDRLIQALALHYHFAAMHPFLDGNGRTARALEALMLQRSGLRDTMFIAMSNYYYENKSMYLEALNATQSLEHNLTPFLNFALRGIELQCQRLFTEIRHQVAKALYRNTMTDLFGRLKSPRKRVISARHIQLLNLFLAEEELSLSQIVERCIGFYGLKNPQKALFRDLNYLLQLEAIKLRRDDNKQYLSVNIMWPTEITETEFFRRSKMLPKGKVHGFLSQ